jgi:ABC-type multidrug transport system ATPase subunit
MFDSILDHLDDFLLKDVKEILYDIKKDRTLIISTRNLNLFSDISNKIIFIENGQIQYNGTMDSFTLNFPR